MDCLIFCFLFCIDYLLINSNSVFNKIPTNYIFSKKIIKISCNSKTKKLLFIVKMKFPSTTPLLSHTARPEVVLFSARVVKEISKMKKVLSAHSGSLLAGQPANPCNHPFSEFTSGVDACVTNRKVVLFIDRISTNKLKK